MENEQILVAGIQMKQVMGNRSVNISTAIKAIQESPGNDIYVLPELSSSGYGVEVFQSLEDLAENRLGPSFNAFSDLARQERCFICYGFPRRTENGQFNISTSVVGPDGTLVASYDKWHVCSTGECCEKDYFSSGNRPLETFEVKGIQVGLAICYDIRFPELTRKLALKKNISLLLHPGGWPRDEGFYTWHTFLRVRAMENSIYIMSANWAGNNNGGTAFCPPFLDGKTSRLAKLGKSPGVLKGAVDKSFLEKARQTCPYLADLNMPMIDATD